MYIESTETEKGYSIAAIYVEKNDDLSRDSMYTLTLLKTYRVGVSDFT